MRLRFNKAVSMFQEYDLLTNKIHELQLREQELSEQLLNQEQRSPSPLSSGVFSMDDQPMDPVVSGGGYQHQWSSQVQSVTPQPLTPSLTPNNSSGNLLSSQVTAVASAASVTSSTSQGSSSPAPKSPMKNMVKAFLPNHQKTAVSTSGFFFDDL